MPRVSVVIASYNHAPFIADSLNSVLAQDFADIEILVTDDGSTDGTAERVAAMGDPRIHLERLAVNRGACVAMNRGIRRARGEYIAVLNSDDVFLPGKLGAQVAFLDAHPQVGAVFGYPLLIDERGRRLDEATRRTYAMFFVQNRSRHQWLRYFFDVGNALCHPTAMIRRALYDTIGLYDARMAQLPDLDLWIRLCRCTDIHVLEQPLTGFRILDGLKNASALRADTIIRDAFERRRTLDHYLALSRQDVCEIFPEYAQRRESVTELLAERALAIGHPYHVQFALEALFNALPREGDDDRYRRLIALTGQYDPYRLYTDPQPR